MHLIDHIAQCRTPFLVSSDNGDRWCLPGAAQAAADIRDCPTRYVLSDDLTTICTDLAYSKGARVFGCMDLLRIPAKRLWVEWSYRPWVTRISEYGFRTDSTDPSGGRIGILVRSSVDGLQGSMRSFWNYGPGQSEVYASSVVSHFRLDGPVTGAGADAADLRVFDLAADPDNILPESFRFGFEDAWGDYYQTTLRNEDRRRKVLLLSMRSLAPAIPFLLAFLLLLLNRNGLPQEPSRLERLNAARVRRGQYPLLEHIQVRAPMWVRASSTTTPELSETVRRSPRLHHVRGHLVRREDQIFWRVPHLRGCARRGIVQSRTVAWSIGADTSLPSARNMPDSARNNEHASGVMSVDSTPA